MAQGQNRLALIFGAFNLLPYLIQQAHLSGKPDDQKHSDVANALASIISIGGPVVEANNPMLAPLIDAGIKTGVAIAKEDGLFTQAAPALASSPVAPIPLPQTAANQST